MCPEEWSLEFHRNLVILVKISGEEQPLDLELSRISFWIWIYDLPLKLRSEAIAKKLGGLIGTFKDMDMKKQSSWEVSPNQGVIRSSKTPKERN